MNAALLVVKEQGRSLGVTGSHTPGNQLEFSCLFFAVQLLLLAALLLSDAHIPLQYRSWVEWFSSLLRITDISHKVYSQSYKRPCQDLVMRMWSHEQGKRGDGLDTRLESVCVNLIMLTDYRFKYFKSRGAHAAGDEESENDCCNAGD